MHNDGEEYGAGSGQNPGRVGVGGKVRRDRT